jgi:hypothetical protein
MDEQASTSNADSVSWTASEFVAHEKSPAWYGVLAGGALFLVALVYLITRDKLSTFVILMACIAIGVYAGRKPDTKTYRVDKDGIKIGNNSYAYYDFRSFSVVEEGAIDAIWLRPMKRFMPIVVMYFEPNDEDRIVDVLSEYLPFEERELDLIDRITRRARF